jgi:hypothetical protein
MLGGASRRERWRHRLAGEPARQQQRRDQEQHIERLGEEPVGIVALAGLRSTVGWQELIPAG